MHFFEVKQEKIGTELTKLYDAQGLYSQTILKNILTLKKFPKINKTSKTEVLAN